MIKEFDIKSKDDHVIELEKEFGLKLRADKETDTVNGYVNSHIENGKVIFEVFPYKKSKLPDYAEHIYRGRTFATGDKVNIKSKGDKEDIEVIELPVEPPIIDPIEPPIKPPKEPKTP
jgi:hypothetical protein